MVIPLPAGGGLNGPLISTPESDRLMKVVKYSVLAMIASFIGQAVCVVLQSGLGALANLILAAVNFLMNIFFGIWLMHEAPPIDKIYECLAKTCCSPCAQEGCPRGMQCLLPFAICNAITVVLALLQGAIHSCWLIFDSMQNAVDFWDAFLLWLTLISFAGAFISQTVGAIYAYRAWKACQAAEGNAAFSGGYPEVGGRNDREEATSQPPRQAAFTPFGGQGQTLGTGGR
eukprot:TRINITY_DN106219_c0_g1_i1.p1 TRINITY_DN106219_c0_g1~~TRINITY_DN106219_c0_g1_i1.p1  ORF type:complete len:230 (-),score=25.58 TRINITY_DN106219_c0_g1_i1:80-769(-)